MQVAFYRFEHPLEFAKSKADALGINPARRSRLTGSIPLLWTRPRPTGRFSPQPLDFPLQFSSGPLQLAFCVFPPLTSSHFHLLAAQGLALPLHFLPLHFLPPELFLAGAGTIFISLTALLRSVPALLADFGFPAIRPISDLIGQVFHPRLPKQTL